jgi:2-polyprenyl-3-methyl-5-hydroxy-6-metoxy-1,4-benzoquinol methylase
MMLSMSDSMKGRLTMSRSPTIIVDPPARVPLHQRAVPTLQGGRRVMGATDWTDEHVRQFWDWFGTSEAQAGMYFSFLSLDHILNILGSLKVLQGRYLDYGCGRGHLAGALLERGLECGGIDLSPESRAIVNQKQGKNKAWLGAVSPQEAPAHFPARSFDLVTCIEVIEHLRDELLESTINEVHRLLKPGGTAFFSTPHAEDLQRTMILCPFCDCVFSRTQHLRSFSEASLTSLLESHGFDVVLCRGIDLAPFATPRDTWIAAPLRRLRRTVRETLNAWRSGRLWKEKTTLTNCPGGDQLIAVATKRGTNP